MRAMFQVRDIFAFLCKFKHLFDVRALRGFAQTFHNLSTGHVHKSQPDERVIDQP